MPFTRARAQPRCWSAQRSCTRSMQARSCVIMASQKMCVPLHPSASPPVPQNNTPFYTWIISGHLPPQTTLLCPDSTGEGCGGLPVWHLLGKAPLNPHHTHTHTHTHTHLSSEGWCCSWQVISGIDHEQYIEIATLCLNEGSSRLGVHKDMGTPMPALCMGPGLWRLAGGEWRPTGEGGQLYLADGMFDVSYGPCGGTLLDGNLLHGVTNLRDFSGTGQTSRPELERFSLIIFSN